MKMDKHFSKDILERYYDNALEPEQAKEIAVHLETCGPCGLYLRSLADLSGILKESLDVNPGCAFSKAVMKNIGEGDSSNQKVKGVQGFLGNIFVLVQKKKVFLGLAASFVFMTAVVFWNMDFMSGNLKKGDCHIDYVYAPGGNAMVYDTKDNIKVVWVFEQGVQ